MRYGSVCSGIEAATVAWHKMGWQPMWFSEIDKFPSEVLSHRYPYIPNMGDMTQFHQWGLTNGSIDLLVGGTPCQSFSIAGLRKGLDDPRGSLMLTYLAIAATARPRWIVWENVPGVLSSNGGKDFGTFLGALEELGYGWAYRILDAQYFGVAQRRRRVFVVGYLGDWRRAGAVLFEHHSLSGNPAPSREAGSQVTGSIVARTGRNGGSSNQDVDSGTLVFGPEGKNISHAVSARDAKGPDSLAAQSTLLVPIAFQSKASASQSMNPSGVVPTLDRSKSDGMAVAIGTDCYNGQITGDVACTMGTPGSSVNASGPTVMQSMRVRRLTPRECERLQGFPDDYTLIPVYGKERIGLHKLKERKFKMSADAPRYKAIGNSMAVPVMRWIGRRISMVEQLT